MKFEPVIGLEVHAQLLTNSKIFCCCSTQFGAEPNSQTCPICLGMPGVLPVLNKRAVDFALRMALATNSKISSESVFERKNYFYPDLPKGYQISQYQEPLCEDGYVEIEVDGRISRIGLTRIHLEEDAGKSVHAEAFVDSNETLVDVNRCGVPLIEIVSEPGIRSPSEAALYLTQLRQIVQYLEICDGNMEEGSFRCDANISVRPEETDELGVKTELKNMNSIRGVEKALEFEIARQINMLEKGEKVIQQSLLWDADRNEAKPMRSKEYADDYRYFPEPDLLPLQINSSWIDQIKATLPELPMARRNRLVEQYGIPLYDANVLTENRDLADYFEKVAQKSGDAKSASNWVMGEVLRSLNDHQMTIKEFTVNEKALADLIKLVKGDTISRNIAKSVLDEMIKSGKPPAEIIRAKGLVQVSDTGEIEQHVRNVLKEYPSEVEKFLAGKEQVFGFLVGRVMKVTRGQANPKMVNEILRSELEKIIDS